MPHADAHAHLAQLLASFAKSEVPISFLDAMDAVRLARRAGELSQEVLSALVSLHDSDGITSGARNVLQDYLRSLAQQQAKERALAARPIRPTDNGKRARASVGNRLQLALLGTADDWQMVTLVGPLRLHKKSPIAASSSGAPLELELVASGLAYLELRRGDTSFALRVVIE